MPLFCAVAPCSFLCVGCGVWRSNSLCIPVLLASFLPNIASMWCGLRKTSVELLPGVCVCVCGFLRHTDNSHGFFASLSPRKEEVLHTFRSSCQKRKRSCCSSSGSPLFTSPCCSLGVEVLDDACLSIGCFCLSSLDCSPLTHRYRSNPEISPCSHLRLRSAASSIHITSPVLSPSFVVVC